MIVLHIVSGLGGGAYRAAIGLHKLLVQAGVDSFVVTTSDRQLGRKVVSKIYTAINRLLTRDLFGIMSIISTNGISKKKIKNYKPDVIHVHNWFNMLSVKELSKLASIAPVVLTLHDERLITGGCHNHLDCSQINNACTSCPALTIPLNGLITQSRKKANAVLRNKKIEIVVPSHWLNLQIEKHVSRVKKVSVIPNLVEQDFYAETVTLNSEPPSAFINIGFVAADPWVPLKGLNQLLESLHDLERSKTINFHLKVVGSVNTRIKLPKFASAVGTKNSTELVELLDKIDFLAVPSMSENFPNVITEAQLRGVVVIATNVGGIPEMVIDQHDGFLQQQSESLTSLLRRALTSDRITLQKMGIQARETALIRSSRKEILLKYTSVYEKATRNAW